MKQAVVALTTHATTYSFAIPGNAGNLRFRNREGTEALQYSFDNFTTYFTIPAPAAATPGGLREFVNWKASPAGQTIYFQTPTNDGKNVELEYSIDG